MEGRHLWGKRGPIYTQFNLSSEIPLVVLKINTQNYPEKYWYSNPVASAIYYAVLPNTTSQMHKIQVKLYKQILQNRFFSAFQEIFLNVMGMLNWRESYITGSILHYVNSFYNKWQ